MFLSRAAADFCALPPPILIDLLFVLDSGFLDKVWSLWLMEEYSVVRNTKRRRKIMNVNSEFIGCCARLAVARFTSCWFDGNNVWTYGTNYEKKNLPARCSLPVAIKF